MSDLVVLREEPLCAETPLALQRDRLTSNEHFYVRNNFPVPTARWLELSVGGAVANPHQYSLEALAELPQEELTVTLECAGNGRAFLDPPAPGEQWGLGAVATAAWTGPRLRDLLEAAAPSPDTVEILFEAADGFARSLPLARALEDDVLLALQMNWEPLPRDHGAPVRLLVGGWYGMASVKWLNRVSAITEPFSGHFQKERYVIGEEPVRWIAPRALITSPAVGTEVSLETHSVRGYAWSADGGARRVEVSADGGATWHLAQLLDEPSRHAWSRWEWAWTPETTGPFELLARAYDASGVQPFQARWNQLGYVNNPIVPHRLTVRGQAIPPGKNPG